MATIKNLTVGQILYDKHRVKAGNTDVSRWGVWSVEVKEIDPEGKFIIASWNGNKPRKYFEREVKRLKVNKPVLPLNNW